MIKVRDYAQIEGEVGDMMVRYWQDVKGRKEMTAMRSWQDGNGNLEDPWASVRAFWLPIGLLFFMVQFARLDCLSHEIE